MRPLRWTLAALSASGCGLVFPTADYTKPLANAEAEAGSEAGAVGDASTPCGSSMPAPPGYVGAPLFEDSFCGSQLDGSKWLAYMNGFDDKGQLRLPRSAPNAGSFEAEFFDPSQVVVNDGLELSAVADTSAAGYTSKSGVLTTAPTVKLTKGPSGRTYVQIRAKVASKPGMWPRAYLGPLVGVNATSVGLFSTGFIDGPASGTPLSNLQFTVGNANAYFDTKADLSTAFYDYGIEIAWGDGVTWFWNAIGGSRQQAAEIKAGAGVSIPTSGDGETLFLALSVINGKDGSSGWHTVWNGADRDVFAIAEVQVYTR
jgi:hypothetical protein